jgi:glycosyltransferase involved in cell wall biosynthesis
MRIGIDARELTGRPTGVGRYLGGLLTQWATGDAARRHEFVLYAPETIDMLLDTRRFAIRVVPGRPGTLWEQFRLPGAVASDHLDVFFAPAYTAPLRLSTPTVVTVHDVSFVAHPEWFRPTDAIRRRWLTHAAAARARAVITVSEFSKQEIIERLTIPADRIHVIPSGIASHQSPVTSPGDARVLFVGSILNRRHVIDLIRAFGRVARVHPDARLDIVGDNRSYPYEDVPSAIAAQGAGDRIQWHKYIADGDLQALYARARAFAFLSEYEGMGLTPLEGLAAGLPPVLADTQVARESCGDAAIYVEPGNLRAIARALELALFDHDTRARILAAAPTELAKYQWPRAATKTLQVLENAVGPRAQSN